MVALFSATSVYALAADDAAQPAKPEQQMKKHSKKKEHQARMEHKKDVPAATPATPAKPEKKG